MRKFLRLNDILTMLDHVYWLRMTLSWNVVKPIDDTPKHNSSSSESCDEIMGRH